jgi:hypothetical protein
VILKVVSPPSPNVAGLDLFRRSDFACTAATAVRVEICADCGAKDQMNVV